MTDQPNLDYTIVNATYDRALITEVHDMLEQGWEPLGAPFMQSQMYGTIWYQAMTRRAQ